MQLLVNFPSKTAGKGVAVSTGGQYTRCETRDITVGQQPNQTAVKVTVPHRHLWSRIHNKSDRFLPSLSSAIIKFENFHTNECIIYAPRK